jgi:gliding motility-associated-like protein
MLEARSDYGVNTINDKSVTVYPLPQPYFQVAPKIVETPDPINLYNKSSNAVRYMWYFGDGDSSDVFEPRHSYMDTGQYNITLYAWSDKECFNSKTIDNAILVEPGCKMLFPNAFTPSTFGPLGGKYNPEEKERKNEIFHPLAKNIVDYEMEIFNRWGEMVFKTNDITIGWDGYVKGKLAKSDNYIWKVRARCNNGRAMLKTGTILLLR